MKWTQRHSRNAVAAKERRRIERALAPVEPEPRRRLPHPRSRALLTVQVRNNKIGDSLTLNLHPTPWPNRWICEQGEFSSAHLGRAFTLLLNAAAIP